MLAYFGNGKQEIDSCDSLWSSRIGSCLESLRQAGKPKCITIHNHFPFMSFSCPFHVFAWAFHVIFRVTCSRSATCFFGTAWCSIIQHDSARTQKPALTSAKLKERQISSSKTDKSRCLMKSVRSVRSVLNPDKSKGDSHGYTVRLWFGMFNGLILDWSLKQPGP